MIHDQFVVCVCVCKRRAQAALNIKCFVLFIRERTLDLIREIVNYAIEFRR